MRPSPSAGSPAPTRRARQRAAAIEEIKALARRQLAEQGPGALSLDALLGLHLAGGFWGAAALLIGLAGGAIQLGRRQGSKPHVAAA